MVKGGEGNQNEKGDSAARQASLHPMHDAVSLPTRAPRFGLSLCAFVFVQALCVKPLLWPGPPPSPLASRAMIICTHFREPVPEFLLGAPFMGGWPMSPAISSSRHPLVLSPSPSNTQAHLNQVHDQQEPLRLAQATRYVQSATAPLYPLPACLPSPRPPRLPSSRRMARPPPLPRTRPCLPLSLHLCHMVSFVTFSINTCRE